MTIDEVFQDQAAKLRERGLSDNAVDKALLFIAQEFIGELIKQQALLQIQLATVEQVKADLQALKDKVTGLLAE
jgi:hypothetical protein